VVKEVFPRKFFPPPQRDKAGRVKWNFMEEPLQKKMMEIEGASSEALRRALANDLTKDFISSLYYKATRNPPENITIEFKGETRSGKSTGGIMLAKLISYWWDKEFTVKNILPNQSELLHRLKDAEYGETFLVDEQIQEAYGEGTYRETEQLSMNLNICAKRCINIIFIYPPHFIMRNAPYGLETIAKDVKSKYIKCYYHDLRRKAFGFGGTWPHGVVYLPKFQDSYYQELPKSKWSKIRAKNFSEKHYDFDSQLEEDYEVKKDGWITEITNLDAGMRNKVKQEIAEKLAIDPKFLELKKQGKREAYLQIMINKGTFMEMAKTELASVVDMAMVLAS